MKPMRIEFAHDHGMWRWDWRMRGTQLGLAMLVAALALGAWALDTGLQAQAELARLQAAAQRRANVVVVRQPAADISLQLQAMRQRALPWEAVFRAFERAPTARLESFEPDLARGLVKVQARVDGLPAMQAYLAALEASPVFQRVALVRHEAIEDGVAFQYEALLAAPYRMAEAVP